MTAGAQRQPLGKAFRVLDYLVESLPADVGVREVAAGIGIPPTTAHRALRHLHAEGLVEGDAGKGRYRIGFRFMRLAWAAAGRFPITNAALPLMGELVEAVDETAFLGLYDSARLELLPAARVSSSHPLQYVVELYQWLPLYAGAGGLGVMSFLPTAERQAIVRRTGLKPVTPLTVTDPAELERVMARFRSLGYARTAGQRMPGAVGLSAPIWGANRTVVGDLVLTIPEQRFDPAKEPRLANHLKRYAGRITEAINGRPSEATNVAQVDDPGQTTP